MLMKQRLSNFAFLRIEGVVRSVESESLFAIFTVLFIMCFLLAHTFFFMRKVREERECVCISRSETRIRPVRPNRNRRFRGPYFPKENLGSTGLYYKSM